nr:MBL fold metallo-hydrolase [Desulfobulbaceae bacterium]
MRFSVLGSGSKGNATFVESGKTSLLIDAGFSGVEIERRMESIGADPASLAGIIVTHEHSDHVKGLGVLARKFKIPVYANRPTCEAGGKYFEKIPEFREFQTGVTFFLNGLTVHPFAINHDTADPVGFTIDDGTTALGYCTDTGMVSRLIHHHLSQCDSLILECNHDLEMLRNGSYPPFLQQRIRSKNGHLANPEAVEFIKKLVGPQLSRVVLAHISESNNCHRLVSTTANSLLEELKLTPRCSPTFTINIATQNQPTELFRAG